MTNESGKADELPEVGGRLMNRTHADFERACKRLLDDEQKKINPDNALIAVLCDAVRLSRECCDIATAGITVPPTRGDGGEMCKVCYATPDADGVIHHGKGCYQVSEHGGGESYVDSVGPILGKLKVHALGDANQYCLISDDRRWVIALKLNGEFLVSQQEEIIRRLIACLNECDGVAIADLEAGKVRAALIQAGFL